MFLAAGAIPAHEHPTDDCSAKNITLLRVGFLYVYLKDNTDKSAAALVDDALKRFGELCARCLGHVLKL